MALPLKNLELGGESDAGTAKEEELLQVLLREYLRVQRGTKKGKFHTKGVRGPGQGRTLQSEVSKTLARLAKSLVWLQNGNVRLIWQK